MAEQFRDIEKTGCLGLEWFRYEDGNEPPPLIRAASRAGCDAAEARFKLAAFQCGKAPAPDTPIPYSHWINLIITLKGDKTRKTIPPRPFPPRWVGGIMDSVCGESADMCAIFEESEAQKEKASAETLKRERLRKRRKKIRQLLRRDRAATQASETETNETALRETRQEFPGNQQDPRTTSSTNEESTNNEASAEAAGESDSVAAQRKKLLADFLQRARRCGIKRVTDKMIAQAANPGRWNERTPVGWWKRNDRRCDPGCDQKIRKLLARDPTTLWPDKIKSV